jgi:hypothetical protein
MIGFSDLEKMDEPTWFEKNKKLVIKAGIVLAVAGVGYYVYTRFMVKSNAGSGGYMPPVPSPAANPSPSPDMIVME